MNASPFRSRRGLIKLKPDTPGQHDHSITLRPNELQRMLDDTTPHFNSSGLLSGSYHGGGGIHDGMSERSMLESLNTEALQQHVDFKEKADMLFPQFVEVLESRSNESEIFDTIQELIHLCTGIYEDIQRDLHRYAGGDGKHSNNATIHLQQEIKTWKLMHALYKDRIQLQQDAAVDCEVPLLACSEKEVITQLYTCNSNLREYQLVVDWLEACYDRQVDGPHVGHSSDRSAGWENTLFQLQNRKGIAFGTGVEIVQHIDPDAPIRENRPLHALDEEDNMRLSKCVFAEIRRGRIEEAMGLCKYCGHTWRAAILEGWRLFEDPNYEHNAKTREKIPIDGNPRRDIWKKCAWMMADSKKVDEYTRAIAGIFCGHLESLKSLLNNSWEDLLWAYLKVQIDIRVESELRASCMRSYHQMPEAYWNSKMSLEQIFDELQVHNDASIRSYANSNFGIIQKYIILDNIPELLEQIKTWVEEATNKETGKTEISSHTLRFFAHIVLLLRQMGRVDKEDSANRIITAYVESLVEMGEPHLIAFYAAVLPRYTQVTLYAKFFEGIEESEKRAIALEEAVNAGLDVESIARTTVENIHQRECDEDDQLQVGDISKVDDIKVKALEWLTFLPSQRGDLLWLANALMRNFLADGKLDCMRNAYLMVPQDCMNSLVSFYGPTNLPGREECSMKEYLSYKVYLGALDSFNDWSRHYHNKPREPEPVSAQANFTERIASEHKEQVYRADLQRWQKGLTEQTDITRTALYNVIVFPEGWLFDPESAKDPVDVTPLIWENRRIQMEKLRSLCIPEVTLILHRILHLTEDYQACVKLAEDIACETRKLYKMYTKHRLAEFMAKIAESSRALLNKKLDPWGYPMTI